MDERHLACPILGGCRPGAEVPRASALGPDAPPARPHLPRWSGRLAFPAPWSAPIPGPLCSWLPSGPTPVVPLIPAWLGVTQSLLFSSAGRADLGVSLPACLMGL